MDATRLMTQCAVLHLRNVSDDGPKDEYNTPLPVDEDLVAPRCFLTPSQRTDESGETSGLSTVQTETYDLFLPPTQRVDGLSAVTVDGVPYELLGPPSRWYHPKTRRVEYIQVNVRRSA